MKRVLLTTGGTGGHIFPALAVAEALQKDFPQLEILFMGSEYGPEKELMAKAGIPFKGLAVRGFIGRGFKGIKAAGQMLLAIGQARKIIKDFQPQVAIGFGGYAAFAPLLAAKWCGIPTALHEQNAVVGVSNRILGKFVNKVFLSMPMQTEESQGFAKEKTVLTGNPVRSSVAEVGHIAHDFSGKKLLVVGGSQGARALNDVVMEYLPHLKDQGVCVRHQTGIHDEARVKTAYASADMNHCHVSAFVDDMAGAYAEADLVLCRAGASTVAELACAGRGAVFVPFPYATHDHQSCNACLLADFGAALSYAEKDMHKQNMMQNVVDLLNNPEELSRMALAAKAQARPQAAQHIAAQLYTMVQD